MQLQRRRCSPCQGGKSLSQQLGPRKARLPHPSLCREDAGLGCGREGLGAHLMSPLQLLGKAIDAHAVGGPGSLLCVLTSRFLADRSHLFAALECSSHRRAGSVHGGRPATPSSPDPCVSQSTAHAASTALAWSQGSPSPACSPQPPGPASPRQTGVGGLAVYPVLVPPGQGVCGIHETTSQKRILTQTLEAKAGPRTAAWPSPSGGCPHHLCPRTTAHGRAGPHLSLLPPSSARASWPHVSLLRSTCPWGATAHTSLSPVLPGTARKGASRHSGCAGGKQKITQGQGWILLPLAQQRHAIQTPERGYCWAEPGSYSGKGPVGVSCLQSWSQNPRSWEEPHMP